MARAGRKRKAGPRHPSGQLVAPNKTMAVADDRIRTSRQPHRRILDEELRTAEEAESPLGRLLLTGYLRLASEADDAAARQRWDAGVMYAAVVGGYRSVIEAPRDVAGSGRGFACFASACLAARDRPADIACECLTRKERYVAAYDALSRQGRRAVMAVVKVAVHREAITADQLIYLVAGLEALARHFDLTGRRRTTHYRNAN